MTQASGRLEAQIGGYKAFLPNPLPPADFSIGAPLQAVLSRADQAVGRLDGAIRLIPDADRFISMFVLREAVLSSQIEGTHASVADVLEYQALQESAAKAMDLQEVVNYVAATNRGLELLEEVPVSARLIKQVHAVLMQDVRGGEPSKTPGEFRKSQNWIGGATPASAVHVPPPWEEAQKSFAQLERFLNEETGLPPLVVIGLAHAQFETIHPFLDGNGRTGRLLVTFWLIANGVLSAPVLYPSLYLKREQDEYVARLQATRTTGAWEAWLSFFLDAVAAAAEEATAIALAIVELRRADEALVLSSSGKRAAIALELLRHLYGQPYVTGAFVVSRLDVTKTTASSLLALFVELGILEETTGKSRDRRYQYSKYLELFPDINDRE